MLSKGAECVPFAVMKSCVWKKLIFCWLTHNRKVCMKEKEKLPLTKGLQNDSIFLKLSHRCLASGTGYQAERIKSPFQPLWHPRVLLLSGAPSWNGGTYKHKCQISVWGHKEWRKGGLVCDNLRAQPSGLVKLLTAYIFYQAEGPCGTWISVVTLVSFHPTLSSVRGSTREEHVSIIFLKVHSKGPHLPTSHRRGKEAWKMPALHG